MAQGFGLYWCGKSNVLGKGDDGKESNV